MRCRYSIKNAWLFSITDVLSRDHLFLRLTFDTLGSIDVCVDRGVDTVTNNKSIYLVCNARQSRDRGVWQ